MAHPLPDILTQSGLLSSTALESSANVSESSRNSSSSPSVSDSEHSQSENESEEFDSICSQTGRTAPSNCSQLTLRISPISCLNESPRRPSLDCLKLWAVLTAVAAYLFFGLLHSNFCQSLNQFKHDSEKNQTSDAYFYVNITHIELFNKMTDCIFWLFVCQLAISASLLAISVVAYRKSKITHLLTVALYSVLTVLATYAFIVSIKHAKLISSSVIHAEIEEIRITAFHRDMTNAVHRLQNDNKCCFVKKNIHIPSDSLKCLLPEEVPYCAEKFNGIVNDYRFTVLMVFILHPVLFLFFLNSNFSRCSECRKVKMGINVMEEREMQYYPPHNINRASA